MSLGEWSNVFGEASWMPRALHDSQQVFDADPPAGLPSIRRITPRETSARSAS